MILSAFTCIAFADQPVPAVPETQGLVTSTSADVVGMATETDAGSWTLTNDQPILYTYYYPAPGYHGSNWWVISAISAELEGSGGSVTLYPYGNGGFYITQISIPQSLLNQHFPGGFGLTLQEWMDGYGFIGPVIAGNGIHAGTVDPGQVQYTTAYDASILGQAGHTVLMKNMNINTGNKVAATQSNLKANTLLTYIASGDGGKVVGSENLLLDGAGNTTSASDRILCPFASQPVDVIPAYCNIVQTGNAYDLTVGTVSSAMSDRFVGTEATIPVQLEQAFSVTPYGSSSGSIPAMGSTSAYVKAHIQEACGYNNVTIITPDFKSYTFPGTPLKAEDLQYSETSSASGVIQQFSKQIHYQSGKSLMP